MELATKIHRRRPAGSRAAGAFELVASVGPGLPAHRPGLELAALADGALRASAVCRAGKRNRERKAECEGRLCRADDLEGAFLRQCPAGFEVRPAFAGLVEAELLEDDIAVLLHARERVLESLQQLLRRRGIVAVPSQGLEHLLLLIDAALAGDDVLFGFIQILLVRHGISSDARPRSEESRRAACSFQQGDSGYAASARHTPPMRCAALHAIPRALTKRNVVLRTVAMQCDKKWNCRKVAAFYSRLLEIPP